MGLIEQADSDTGPTTATDDPVECALAIRGLFNLRGNSAIDSPYFAQRKGGNKPVD
jgi:hypothetical protein